MEREGGLLSLLSARHYAQGEAKNVSRTLQRYPAKKEREKKKPQYREENIDDQQVDGRTAAYEKDPGNGNPFWR